jgi:flagellar biosynthesis protein FliQ
MVALAVTFPWLLETLTRYTTSVFNTIANVTR